MVQYRVFYSEPHRHFISFESEWIVEVGEVLLQLPSWRPGRYELGNFAKNITNVKAYDSSNELLQTEKRSKDCWSFQNPKKGKIKWTYDYYAADLNAGSTFLDSSQLYINPVNCFFFQVGKADQPYRIEFSVPQDYVIASGLKQEAPHILLADSFDHLADGPLIASNTIQHFEYSCRNVPFHIWIQGKIQFNIEKLVYHFRKFTEEHFAIFGDIPCRDYHFLFQFPEIVVRHGVEHRNSTVIAMGPSETLAGEEKFFELLGISCHELFHTWNVKNIRPIEMLPYDFTRENYSPSGLVYEGVTTYYGDLLLWRVGTFSDLQFLEIISETLENHINNDGRFHLSLAKSSLETWLDGYVLGNPWRKVNIYNEGSLIAFICDVRIIANTGGKSSLDDVMVLLYNRFGKENKGYKLEDYKALLEEVGKVSFDDIFSDIVWGEVDYLKYVKPTLALLDMSMKLTSNEHLFTALTGARYSLQSDGTWLIGDVMENSPADRAGLWRGDIILRIDENVPSSFSESKATHSNIHFISQGIERSAEIYWESKRWYNKISLEYKGNSAIYDFWKKRART